MTTIIAREKNGKVELGWDSLCTGNDSFELEREKVFTNNGVAGRLLLNAELKHAQMPSVVKDPALTDKWLTSSLMPHLRRVVDVVAPRRGHDEYEMQIILVINNRVYEVGVDTSWMRRVDGMYAIGSGSPYAMGAMKNGASIADALKIAAHIDPYTGGRLTVTDSTTVLAHG